MKVKNLYRDVTKRRYFKASALSGRMGIGFCFFQGVRFALLPFQGMLTKAGAWDFRHARFTSLTLPFQAFHNGHTWR